MPKNQTKASTPVPAQESRSPVSFDVRVYPVKDSKYTSPTPMWTSTAYSPFAA